MFSSSSLDEFDDICASTNFVSDKDCAVREQSIVNPAVLDYLNSFGESSRNTETSYFHEACFACQNLIQGAPTRADMFCVHLVYQVRLLAAIPKLVCLFALWCDKLRGPL